MLIQRSIPITFEKSEDLRKTIEEFNRYQKSISEICFNSGKTRSALSLHKEVYKSNLSSLCAQMKCSAIRLVASAYVSSKSNRKPAERPKDSVLVLEDLKIKKVSKKEHVRKGTRRKLNSFCYNLLIQGITNRAQRDGIGIEFVKAAYTSQTCNACGLLGDRIG